jgi:hypothetical protein
LLCAALGGCEATGDVGGDRTISDDGVPFSFEVPTEFTKATIDGLPSDPISRNWRTKRAVASWRCTSGVSAAKPPRFAPLENVRSCDEARTTQRTASSSRARSKASMSSPSSSADSALRVAGSSRVIVATPSAAA